jgi:hypothetical protein
MSRLESKIQSLRNDEADKALAGVRAIQEQKELVESGILLGATGALRNLTSSLTTQTIRALQHFRDTKQHEKLGFSSFDEFLNKSEYAPMSYRQFNTREKVLEAEGDVAFDVLSDLNVPIQTRKLLTDGQVRVDGDLLIIGEADQIQEVPVHDHKRVKQVIKTLAEENGKKNKLIATQKEKIKKGSEEFKAKQKELDHASTGKPAPYEQALLNLIGSFTALAIELEGLPAHERTQKRDYTFKQISDQRLRLEELFNIKAPKLSKKEREAGLDGVIEELSDEM